MKIFPNFDLEADSTRTIREIFLKNFFSKKIKILKICRKILNFGHFLVIFFENFFFSEKFFQKNLAAGSCRISFWIEIWKKFPNFFLKFFRNEIFLNFFSVNFIFLEIRPGVRFSICKKWVLWGLRNPNLPSEPHRQAKNWTLPCYHTWYMSKHQTSNFLTK